MPGVLDFIPSQTSFSQVYDLAMLNGWTVHLLFGYFHLRCCFLFNQLLLRIARPNGSTSLGFSAGKSTCLSTHLLNFTPLYSSLNHFRTKSSPMLYQVTNGYAIIILHIFGVHHGLPCQAASCDTHLCSRAPNLSVLRWHSGLLYVTMVNMEPSK